MPEDNSSESTSSDVDQYVKEYERDRDLYDAFGKEITRILETAIKDRKIKIHSVMSRAKTPESLRLKLQREEYSQLTRHVTDLAGVRVVTFFPKDVDQVARIVEGLFAVDRENSIDKRMSSDPDRFGYASVHYVVELDSVRSSHVEYKRYAGLKCEIQVRTILQHAWAEIEHDMGYKAAIAIPTGLRRRFSALSGLLEVADREFENIREEEEALRESVEKDLQRKRLDIPIDIVSLREYIRDKEILGRRLADIPDEALSSLIEDMYEMKITDLRMLDRIISESIEDVRETEKELQSEFVLRTSLHAAGVLRIVLAVHDPVTYSGLMRKKSLSDYEEALTKTLITIVNQRAKER